MNRTYASVIKKADALFKEANYISHINNQDDYEQALMLMDNLIEDYDHNRALIEVLSMSIERWEESADEFENFNRRVANTSSDIAMLKLLMDQHNLRAIDLPEIGSKSLVSKILHGQRQLTKDHIAALSKRFKIGPELFF